MEHRLGSGMLTWMQGERITDRYGTVFLTDCDSLGVRKSEFQMDSSLVHSMVGRTGTLVAEVVQTRPSTHEGDWDRGVYPKTPAVGERITLGSGLFFSDGYPRCRGTLQVGVRPLDGRKIGWLDVQALYRAHEQTVILLFVPSGPPG